MSIIQKELYDSADFSTIMKEGEPKKDGLQARTPTTCALGQNQID
jgi:hypothetical protein